MPKLKCSRPLGPEKLAFFHFEIVKIGKMAKTARRSHLRQKCSSQNFFRTCQNVGLGFEIFKIGPEMAILGQIKLTDLNDTAALL